MLWINCPIFQPHSVPCLFSPPIHTCEHLTVNTTSICWGFFFSQVHIHLFIHPTIHPPIPTILPYIHSSIFPPTIHSSILSISIPLSIHFIQQPVHSNNYLSSVVPRKAGKCRYPQKCEKKAKTLYPCPYLPICQSIHLSICLFILKFICPLVLLSTCPPIHLSIQSTNTTNPTSDLSI
jgi:hypothetical protein